MENFKFEYLYRDEDNYKLFGSIYLENKNKISLDDAEIQVKEKLIDGEYFYPQELGIELFAEHLNRFNPFDGWYEFERISEVNKKKKIDLDLEIFLKQLAKNHFFIP